MIKSYWIYIIHRRCRFCIDLISYLSENSYPIQNSSEKIKSVNSRIKCEVYFDSPKKEQIEWNVRKAIVRKQIGGFFHLCEKKGPERANFTEKGNIYASFGVEKAETLFFAWRMPGCNYFSTWMMEKQRPEKRTETKDSPEKRPPII